MSRSEPLTRPDRSRGASASALESAAALAKRTTAGAVDPSINPRRSRLEQWLLHLLVGAALVLFALWAINPVPCSDLWWQLKTGELIWIERAIPRTDRFSFMAAGRPWIIQEWATELMFYLLYAKVSAAALVLFKLLAFAAAMG